MALSLFLKAAQHETGNAMVYSESVSMKSIHEGLPNIVPHTLSNYAVRELSNPYQHHGTPATRQARNSCFMHDETDEAGE